MCSYGENLNKIMLAMPVDQHKKKFIQVKNTIKIEYYYLYLIQELLVVMHVLKGTMSPKTIFQYLREVSWFFPPEL